MAQSFAFWNLPLWFSALLITYLLRAWATESPLRVYLSRAHPNLHPNFFQYTPENTYFFRLQRAKNRNIISVSPPPRKWKKYLQQAKNRHTISVYPRKQLTIIFNNLSGGILILRVYWKCWKHFEGILSLRICWNFERYYKGLLKCLRGYTEI